MPKPNVLWIMTDQHNANCLGFLGSQVRTPNLDSLAAEGVSLSRAYCNNPICAPSRASYMTGQYVHTHGMQGNYVAMYPERNPETLAALFRRSGYRTGLLGKGHIPRAWMNEGFERMRFTDLCDAEPTDPRTCHYFQHLCDEGLGGWYEDGSPRPGHRGDHDGTAAAVLPYEHSIERFTGDETVRFLEDGRDDDRPFFAWMTFQRPHAPMTPAREYFDLYDPDKIRLPESAVDWFERRFSGKPRHIVERLRDGSGYPLADADPEALKTVLAAYYAMIECIDMEIGRAFAWLRERDEWENTIVVFSADHGDFAGEHGLFHKNMGIYESIHRVPFMLRYPGGPTGDRADGIIESVDLYPTLCELAGIQAPEGVEGSSILPVIDGRSDGKEEALCEWSWGGAFGRINALRTRGHRIVYYGREEGGELYDCEADPGEIENLWGDPAHADVRREMTERLFDRVNQYRAACEFQDDRRLSERDRFTPRELVHKRRKGWAELEEAYTTPSPARGPIR